MTRFCKDCKYYLNDKTVPGYEHLCLFHRDKVTGETYRFVCALERAPEKPGEKGCGPTGLHWDPLP